MLTRSTSSLCVTRFRSNRPRNTVELFLVNWRLYSYFMSIDTTTAAMPRPIPAPLADPTTAKVTPTEAAAMMRAVFNLFRFWGVSDAQARVLLGDPSSSTFYRWKRGEIAGVPHDTVSRLGDLMGIHKALRYLFTDPARGYAWMGKPNEAFGGRSALARMLGGAPGDVTRVREYLDAERGGW